MDLSFSSSVDGFKAEDTPPLSDFRAFDHVKCASQYSAIRQQVMLFLVEKNIASNSAEFFKMAIPIFLLTHQ